MNFTKVLRTAVKSLALNPLRTFLTLLGIIIGVAAVIALMSVGSATTSSVTSSIQGLGTNLLVISPGQSVQNGVSQGLGTAQSLTDKDVAALQKLPVLSAVAPDQTSRAQVVYGSTNYQTVLEGSTPDLFSVRNLSLSAGRPFNLVEEQHAANVAVIGSTVAQNVFGNQNPVGKTIWLNGLAFQVIGELTTQGSSGATNNDDRIIIPLTTLENHFTGTTNPDDIYASATSSQDMTQAQQEVELTLRQSHGLSYTQPDDFVITNQSTLLDTLQGVTQTLQSFLRWYRRHLVVGRRHWHHEHHARVRYRTHAGNRVAQSVGSHPQCSASTISCGECIGGPARRRHRYRCWCCERHRPRAGNEHNGSSECVSRLDCVRGVLGRRHWFWNISSVSGSSLVAHQRAAL